MITNEQLTRIKECAEKAKSGEMYVTSSLAVIGGYDVRVKDSKTRTRKVDTLFAVVETLEDAQFIAHAREDVLMLVAEVERLQAELTDIIAVATEEASSLSYESGYEDIVKIAREALNE